MKRFIAFLILATILAIMPQALVTVTSENAMEEINVAAAMDSQAANQASNTQSAFAAINLATASITQPASNLFNDNVPASFSPPANSNTISMTHDVKNANVTRADNLVSVAMNTLTADQGSVLDTSPAAINGNDSMMDVNQANLYDAMNNAAMLDVGSTNYMKNSVDADNKFYANLPVAGLCLNGADGVTGNIVLLVC
jgi:hypothetical protein